MLRRLHTAGLVVLLCILAVEGSAWVVFTWLRPKPRILRYDAKLGWANKENLDVSPVRADGVEWPVRTDSFGMRVVAERPSNSVENVVVLGDSFVFGDSIEPEKHFLSHLGKNSNKNYLNAGVVGYATDQQLGWLKAYSGTADSVIVMSYLSNDLRDNLSHFETGGLRFKPKYRFEEHEAFFLEAPFPLLNSLRNRSYLTTIWVGVLFKSQPALSLFDPPSQTDSKAKEVKYYVELLGLIVEEARQKGAKQVLVLTWSHHSSGSENVPEILAELGKKTFAISVDSVDLDTSFKDVVSETSELYFSKEVDPGGHWNSKGHQIVANVILKWLNKSVAP